MKIPQGQKICKYLYNSEINVQTTTSKRNITTGSFDHLALKVLNQTPITKSMIESIGISLAMQKVRS